MNYRIRKTYISDIVKRNKIRNIGEIEALLDILASAIGALTNPNKLQKIFKSVNRSKITATTITKYIVCLEDAFLIEEAVRYDINGKSYIGTPLKYYFMDMGLRNARIHYRQIKEAGCEEHTNSRANLWSDEQKSHMRPCMRVRLSTKLKSNNYTECFRKKYRRY